VTEGDWRVGGKMRASTSIMLCRKRAEQESRINEVLNSVLRRGRMVELTSPIKTSDFGMSNTGEKFCRRKLRGIMETRK